MTGSWDTLTVARGLPSSPVAVFDLPSSGAHVSFCCGGEICITDTTSTTAGGRAKWTNKPSLKNASGKEETVSQEIMRSRNWRDSGRNVSENHISCGAVAAGLAATGGMEHDACLIDLETGTIRWQARNVKNDNLQLRRPVWVTALSFLDGPAGDGQVMIPSRLRHENELF